MQNQLQKMDQNLLERFFKGECSPVEHDRIVAWYLSGEADLEISKRIEAYWKEENQREFSQPGTAPNGDDWGKEALFDAISISIDESAGGKKNINITDRITAHTEWKPWRYAAVVTLLIVLSGWWYFNHYFPQERASGSSLQVNYITKQTARGEKRSITLHDGTVVKLNAESRLRFSHTFGQDSVREVYLQGEAFFDVVRDTLHPFQIHTGSVITTVLGTSFNVQAFVPDEEVAVSVVSGRVKVAQQDAAHEKKVYLLSGEQALYSKHAHVVAKKKFDYQEVLSWKEGRLYFKNASFSEIVADLERWYGVEIEVQRQGIEDGFSGAYTNKSLESVLEGMSFVLDFNYQINGRKIIIK